MEYSAIYLYIYIPGYTSYSICGRPSLIPSFQINISSLTTKHRSRYGTDKASYATTILFMVCRNVLIQTTYSTKGLLMVHCLCTTHGSGQKPGYTTRERYSVSSLPLIADSQQCSMNLLIEHIEHQTNYQIWHIFPLLFRFLKKKTKKTKVGVAFLRFYEIRTPLCKLLATGLGQSYPNTNCKNILLLE